MSSAARAKAVEGHESFAGRRARRHEAPGLREPWLTAAVGFCAFLLYWNTANLRGDPMRPDFFLLADAFLHGRTWVDPAMLQQPWDRIDVDGRTYVAFAPLPAILMVPFVAVFGVTALAPREAIVNAALGGLCVALCWRLVARYDSGRLADRFWIVALFALSTPLWWVVTLGGVWHTGQLAATCMTLLALLEATKRRRPWVLGLLGGAAFLARFPTLLALPFYAWLAMAQRGVPKVRVPTTPELGRGALAVVGFLPAALFDAWYNLVRFGAPLETGYRLATTAPFLQPELMKGLFSVRHLGRNLDFLLWHLPKMDGGPPRPDGFGLSVLVTSPGLLLALNADWKDPLMRWAAITGLVVLLPSLFWWGGGWYQLGFRYLLDALPFIMLPVASGARNGVSTAWKALIVFGGLVSVWGIYSFLNVPIPVPQ